MASGDFGTIRAVIYLSAILIFAAIWLGVVVLLRTRRHRSRVYVMFFTLFYVYAIIVLDYTLFEFQSLLLLKQFVPDLILAGQEAGERVNLVPLIGLGSADLKTSLLNILLMVPFGLGLPLITPLRLRHVIAAGALFSVAIELLQLTTGLMAGITFRIADVNDVIFNTIGVAVGCVLFVGLVRIARRLSSGRAPSSSRIVRFVAGQPRSNQRR